MELINQVINDDCFNIMPHIPDEGIDCIISDMPFNLTACKFDKEIIDLEKLWIEYKRITKPNAAIVLFGSQPFTSKLVMSNPKMFKYELIWEKAVGSNFALLKYQPIKEHENILVFSKSRHNYYPIMQQRKGDGESRSRQIKKHYPHHKSETGGTQRKQYEEIKYPTLRNPSSLAIACLNLNRKYICIEKDTNYYEISLDRINKHATNNQ